MLRNRLSSLLSNTFLCILHKDRCTFFVLFVDDDCLASRHEFFFDSVSEVVVDVAEGEHVLVDRIVAKPLH